MTQKTVLVLALAGLSLPLWAQQQTTSCKPNFEVTHAACRETDKVTGYAPIVKTVRVAEGACQPDDEALCNEHANDELNKVERVLQPQGIKIKRAYHNDTVGKFCGGIGNLRAKVDVICDYEFQAPVKERVADEACPVESVADSAGCFAADKPVVNVAASDIVACLDSKPQTEAELWTKVACLSAANKAQNALRFQTDLSSEVYDRIQVQLRALASRTDNPDGVNRLLQDSAAK